MSTIKYYGPQVLREVKREAAKRLDKAAFLVEAKAKRNAPVDEGILMGSILTQRTGLISQVGSKLPYALKMEFGGSRKAPNGYLRIALIDSLSSIRKIFS